MLITPKERFWVTNYNRLLEAGYQLRPRFHPEWKPSAVKYAWKMAPEDHKALFPGHEHLNDAIRISDQCHVMLRSYNSDTERIVLDELRKPQAQSPHNRTVPILDELEIDGTTIFVMPFLRQFDDPPFLRRSECLEAIRQILQGLKFMHENKIAHNDACRGNIMMDSSSLIPTSFSLIRPWTTDGLYKNIKYRTRFAVRPVNYYFIDFETAAIYPEGQHSSRSVRFGRVGQDETPPEFSEPVIPFYHAFKLDIYQVGNHVLRQCFLEHYDGLEFLAPLVEKMTHNKDYERIDAAQALALFESLVSDLDARTLRMDYIVEKPDRIQTYFPKNSRRHRRKAKLYNFMLDKFSCLGFM
ncbi:hypothetical protein BDZ89DRAFT_1062891 [Hymenopellis radicata]|nr:hypothetical protein BDZ89DRAFT_1062891 [Hymenopellis radicata]